MKTTNKLGVHLDSSRPITKMNAVTRHGQGTRVIYGRTTHVNKIVPESAIAFTKAYHRDGVPANMTGVQAFGLYTADEELVAVAIMGNPRTRGKIRRYSAELIRLTFKKDVRVIGGASKLLRYIMNNGMFYDFFTYQDTAGEATDIYRHAGMTFVSQSVHKEYLVKDGYTLKTADRHQKFSMAYAVQFGPDRILGTKLGQDTGKSNRELFLENGYHIETTTGDRVYEWFNPNYVHYVYRLTSIADDGTYYIGAHSVLKNEEDVYMGSGGVKFINWKSKLQEKYGHTDVFCKEILSYHSSRCEAFLAEEQQIGDAYQNDPLCKNSTSGGRGSAKRQHNGKGVKRGINDLASQYPELVQEFDIKKNYPLTPEDVHSGTPTKVWWVCEHGHQWQSEVRKRVQGFGCPFCAGQRALQGENDLQSLYPDIARQLLPDQEVSACEVSAHSHKKLWWVCDANPKHIWQASVDSRTRGRGCPYCSGNKVLAGDNDLATTNPELVSWWSDKNTIQPTEISAHSNKKVWWVCEHGHEFDMSPATKLISGCPVCSNKRVLAGYNDFKSQNPELMAEWSDKNEIQPDSVTSASVKKVWWVCEHGHEWQMPIRTRVRYNSPCPVCRNNNK